MGRAFSSVTKQFDTKWDVKIGFVPRSLVGGAMAHQDDAGLRSVKYPVTPAADLCRAPFGEYVTSAALEATPEPQDRPLESRPSWSRIHACLPRETRCGFCALESLQCQPRRVRECTSRCVRSQPAPSFGMERLTLGSKMNCCLFRERAGQTRRSKGDPGAARRVQESRLSWRLSADWSSFGRAGEQST